MQRPRGLGGKQGPRMRPKSEGEACSTMTLPLGEPRKREPRLCYPGQQKHVLWSIRGPESKSLPSEKEAGSASHSASLMAHVVPDS